ncbi:MAG TPA: hypothetical protein VNC22_14590 [Sporichthya sp.]|nr:hypothetical protein [Sporichthya sp.]
MTALTFVKIAHFMALATATVTRDGRTHTFATGQNAAGGLFGLTNMAAGKTTRVDWVYTGC